MSALVVAGQGIRMDAAGRFSLNDLHRAGGGANKHRPSLWLKSTQVKGLIAELDNEAGIPALAAQRGGACPGTYGRRELALAFAAWISPSFHVRVLRAADTVFSGQVQPAQQVQAALSDPSTLRALLLDQADARLLLEAETQRLHGEIARAAPKVVAFDRLSDCHGAMSLTAAAKVLGMRPRDFFAWLSSLKWIYRAADAGSWLGHAKYTDAGCLEHRMFQPEGSHRQRAQVLVTAKGIAKLALLLEQASLPSALQAPVHPSAKRITP